MKTRNTILISLLILIISIVGCTKEQPENILKSTINNKNTPSVKEKNNTSTLENRNTPKSTPESTPKPTPKQTANKEKKETIEDKVILDAPIIDQNPELRNGCEVTSVAMMLQYAGVKVDKLKLADEVKKDSKKLKEEGKDIIEWGDPKDGFVGDIEGKDKGFGVYNKPIFNLVNKYLPGRAVDLTGHSFDKILESIKNKRPVVVWLTADFEEPHSFEKWKDGDKEIKATFQEHAVLLVGYDEKYCYINNPLGAKKEQKINKSDFKKVWQDMGSMAVSYN